MSDGKYRANCELQCAIAHVTSFVHADMSEIIHKFLCRDPSKRLGSLVGGEDDIPKQAFLKNIDFDQLRQKKLVPPHVPAIKDSLDASNFDDWSSEKDKRNKRYPKLSKAEDEVFDDF